LPSSGELEDRILDLLRSAGRPLTIGEIASSLGWEGDLRPLRRILADMVRRGLVERVPDYDRGRMAFRARGGGSE
jgi:DNA-binding IclR family transcriptional regulator